MKMRTYREDAWDVANRYSHYLASETRDLAAWIEKALNEAEQKACAELLAQLKEADQLLARCSSRIDPEQDKDLWQEMVVNAETTRALIEQIEGPPPPITEDDLIF